MLEIAGRWDLSGAQGDGTGDSWCPKRGSARAGAAHPLPSCSIPSTGRPTDTRHCHLISILSLWKAIFPDYWLSSSGTDKFILGKKKYSLASHSWKATHLTQGFHNSEVREATHLFDRKIAQYIFRLYYTVSMQSGHSISWLVCLSFSFVRMKIENHLICLDSTLPSTGMVCNGVLQHTA